MIHRFPLVLIALVPSLGIAQVRRAEIKDPKTPAECQQWSSQESNRTYTTAIRAGKSLPYDSMIAQRTSLALKCAAQFNVAKLTTDQLEDLVSLYLFANSIDKAQQVADHFLQVAKGPDHGKALLSAMRVTLHGAEEVSGWKKTHPPAERVAKGEQLGSELGKLGPEAAAAQVAGYLLLSKAYYEENVDVSVRHLKAAIAAAEHIPQPARLSDPKVSSAIANAYVELAKIQAYQLDAKEALATLDRGTAALGNDSMKTRSLRELRGLYAMIGQPAPALFATNWLNTERSDAHELPLKNHVTLVEFTAHW
jgi:hypothetical protein